MSLHSSRKQSLLFFILGIGVGIIVTHSWHKRYGEWSPPLVVESTKTSEIGAIEPDEDLSSSQDLVSPM